MSVLRIYQNPIALNSLRNLQITGMSISKSLERLSSGLRINRAADDAAGLSISEKLRAQIRGLNRASTNALDGISLIQTAEGALNEVHSILQRMRELAVQAANGIYTASDRQAIQLEVSQLTDEINRIASSTEFNTKKLLDGTLGALISTDDFSRVQAAVVGAVGKGGNFVMKAALLSTGQLQVHKTDVFATQQAVDAVGKVNYLHTWRAHASLASATSSTGLIAVAVPVSGAGSVAVQSPTNGRISMYDATLASAGRNYVSVFQASGVSGSDHFVFSFMISDGGGNAGHIIASFSAPSVGTDLTSFAAIMSVALTNATSGYNGVVGNLGLSAVNYDAANGRFSFAVSNAAVVVDGVNVQFLDGDNGESAFYLSFNNSGTQSNIFVQSASIAFINNGATFNFAQSYAANGGVITVGSIGVGVNTGQVNLLFGTEYSHWGSIIAGTANFADMLAWAKYEGGNTFAEHMLVSQTGAPAANGTYVLRATGPRTYQVFSFNNAAYSSLVAAGYDQSGAYSLALGTTALADTTGATTFSLGQAFNGDNGGPLENVRLSWNSPAAILQAGETATFNVSTNNVLTGDQGNTLASLNRFQDFGVFLGRNNIEFTVYLRGTNQQAVVNLSKNDTLEDLANKLSLAIWNAAGTGLLTSALINPLNAPDLVHVNTIGMAKGTISITTPVPGAEIVIAGDEAFLNAMSLMEISQAEAPTYSISAFNLETGATVGQVKTDSNEIVGLLPGLRIFFDTTMGMRLDPDPPAGGGALPTSFAYFMAIERPELSVTGTVDSFFVHVAPRDFNLQIGANQGQNIKSYIADQSAKALGVEGLLVTETGLAEEAITIIDIAIGRVSDTRSRLGAIQNRLESTIRNLDITAENLTASESRIRDADVAMETTIMTRNQILLQAGVAALAQANQLPQSVLQLLR
jgi:flagellin